MGENAKNLFLTPLNDSSFKIGAILIDAGHGGKDSGAIGKNGRREADIVLEAVFETKRLLERNGEIVLLTRASDINLDAMDRVDIANNWNADYFVSFHMNSFIDNSVESMSYIPISIILLGINGGTDSTGVI